MGKTFKDNKYFTNTKNKGIKNDKNNKAVRRDKDRFNDFYNDLIISELGNRNKKESSYFGALLE